MGKVIVKFIFTTHKCVSVVHAPPHTNTCAFRSTNNHSSHRHTAAQRRECTIEFHRRHDRRCEWNDLMENVRQSESTGYGCSTQPHATHSSYYGWVCVCAVHVRAPLSYCFDTERRDESRIWAKKEKKQEDEKLWRTRCDKRKNVYSSVKVCVCVWLSNTATYSEWQRPAYRQKILTFNECCLQRSPIIFIFLSKQSTDNDFRSLQLLTMEMSTWLSLFGPMGATFVQQRRITRSQKVVQFHFRVEADFLT